MATVGLTFNLIHEEEIGEKPVDCIAELDTPETINTLKEALESGGHTVILLEADETIVENIKRCRNKLDIVFNIAEGLRGESRESHVPAILEMLGIPYVGSGPLTLAVCLNKVRTKEILCSYDIPTPAYQVFYTEEELPHRNLHFPLITKLSNEGSSMGLSYDSVVDDEKALQKQVANLIRIYHQPVLVEEFIEGREFGIPVIGNSPPVSLPLIEFHFHGKWSITIFIPDKPLQIFKEKNYEIPDPMVTNKCPADIPVEMEKMLIDLALRSYKALECRDWCRLEIRVDRQGNPFVIELNPIAGIDPSYRFAVSAQIAGINYAQLINKILVFAMERYGMETGWYRDMFEK
jgi:D-alanine-D-alanine ligase